MWRATRRINITSNVTPEAEVFQQTGEGRHP